MDITLEQLIDAIEDESLKNAVSRFALPEDFTMNEFLVKWLEAATIAAEKQNETLDPGKKILGYPPATNGAIARTQSNQLYFPRTSAVVSRVVVNLDQSTPNVG